MSMKTQGQRNNRSPIETLALVFLGVSDGHRNCLLEAARSGVRIPPAPPIMLSLAKDGRKTKVRRIAVAGSENGA
jgi:hypothetical protein